MEIERTKSGIRGLDELISGGFPKESTILVSGGPGTGKCLDYNEQVVIRSEKGWQIKKIGDIVEEKIKKSNFVKEIPDGFISFENLDNLEVVTFNQKTLKIEVKTIKAFVKRESPQYLLKIITDSGRSIITTADHNFITLKEGHLKIFNGEKLSIGDHLPIAGVFPTSKTDNNLDLLPFYATRRDMRVFVEKEIGKQTPRIKDRYNIHYGIREKGKYYTIPLNDFLHILPHIENINLQKTFLVVGRSPLIPLQLNLNKNWMKLLGYYVSEGHMHKTEIQITIKSDEIASEITSLADSVNLPFWRGMDRDCNRICLSKSFSNFFNLFGSTASKKTIPDFIFGLGDELIESFLSGYFIGDGWIERRKKKNWSVSQNACSKSKDLILRLGLLALKFGYIPRFGEKEVNGKKYYSLRYTKSSFGFKLFDIIPNIGMLFRELRRSEKIGYGKYRHHEVGAKNFTRSTLAKALSTLKKIKSSVVENDTFQWLSKLTHSDIRWDKIVKIEKVSPSSEYVYDLTVDNHNFLTLSGIFVHNTTFCLNFLVNGALKYKESGVYISLEEDPKRVIDNFKTSFSWPIDELIKKKMLKFVKAELYDFDKLKILIEDEVDAMKAKRLVIDPTTIISLYFEKPLEIRRSIFDLDRGVKKLGCTSLLICEVPEGKKGISAFGVEEFVADGIIVLYYVEGRKFTRGLSIRKMRATRHDTRIHPMEITREGVVVYTTESIDRVKIDRVNI